MFSSKLSDRLFQCDASLLSLNENDTKINKITRVSNSGYSNSSVTQLIVMDQECKKFPLGIEKFFANLRSLAIKNSSLMSVANENLKKLPKLVHLDLSKNQIYQLDNDLFVYNRKLKFVNLEGNLITIIGSDTFSPLIDLIDIDLRNNAAIDANFNNLANLLMKIHLMNIEKILLIHQQRLKRLETKGPVYDNSISLEVSDIPVELTNFN